MSRLPTLIATSVVRGSQQGDSHGGVYLVDFANEVVTQPIDWNSGDIDFQGRGWDRGLRGIEFDDDSVYIAASDELFVYDPDFGARGSYRNQYLKHAHEMSRFGRNLFIASTGFNSILAFDLDKKRFTWGLHIAGTQQHLQCTPFDPESRQGPDLFNRHHINNVFCDELGMYISGRGTGALLHFDGSDLSVVAEIPLGVHNARPYGAGILYNDTEADALTLLLPTKSVSFRVPTYESAQLTHANFDGSALARQGFGRGLCVLGESLVAAGSSPSTVRLYDFETEKAGQAVNLTMDIRNSVHGLEVWPY